MRRQATAGHWPLLVILMVQATVTLWVIILSNGPSNDEALYLGVGHLELAHVLHGTAAPAVSGYFSGGPVLYPPAGAAAYLLGGLAGARVLSLMFMLGATALLWLAAARLYSRTVAACAATMFALLAPVLHLGSLATFDAMSLFFVALAGWCALRPGWRWLTAAGAAIVTANAVKYASALFDPVIIAVAAAPSWELSGGRWPPLHRPAALTGGIIAAVAGLLAVAGPGYWRGVHITTLTRRVGPDSVPRVLEHAMVWGWAVLILAVAGFLIGLARQQPRARSALLGVMAAAGFLAPIEQARIHTLLSLDKHLAFGAWFAAVPAGYAADYLLGRLRARVRRLGQGGIPHVAAESAAALAIPLVVLGWTQAQGMASYSQTDYLIPVLRPLTAHGGRFLSDTARVDAYSLPGVPWDDWVKVQLNETRTRTQVLAGQILHHRFTVIALAAANGRAPQAQLRAVLAQDPEYALVSRVPSSGPGHRVFLVWKLTQGGR